MSTFVVRITIDEILDNPGHTTREVTDMTVHGQDFDQLRNRVSEILSLVDVTEEPEEIDWGKVEEKALRGGL